MYFRTTCTALALVLIILKKLIILSQNLHQFSPLILSEQVICHVQDRLQHLSHFHGRFETSPARLDSSGLTIHHFYNVFTGFAGDN